MQKFSGFRLILVIWGSLWFAQSLFGQTSLTDGIPYFHTYFTRDYPGEQQMFDATQWHDGSILFANAGGLVQHADDEWRIFARFDATFISHLKASEYEQNLVWSGNYSNMGYFVQDELGAFDYVSLSHLIPEGYSDFSDVYSIQESEDEVLFFSDLYLFSFDKLDSTLAVIEHIEYNGKKSRPLHFTVWQGKEYFFQANGDVVTKTGSNWQQIQIEGEHRPKEFLTVLGTENKLYIIDNQEGLFTFDGTSFRPIAEQLNGHFESSTPTDFKIFENGDIAISSDDGVVILDEYGELKYVFNEKIGFPENDVSGLLIDEEGDLWILGPSTVTKVYMSNPVRHLPGEALGFGDALHIRQYNDRLYIPAMEGMYQLDEPITNLVYKQPDDIFYEYPVKDIFWNTLDVEGELWVASQAGVFKIIDDNLNLIVPEIEGRQLRQLTEHVILIVTYNGLDWLLKENNSWNYKGTLETVPEHILELAVVPGKEFWAGGVSGYIFRGRFDEKSQDFVIKRFGVEDGLPETDMLEPTVNGDKIIVNTKYGFYLYDDDSETFSPMESINDQLGNWGEYLRQDKYGALWTQYANIEGYNGVIHITPDDEIEWNANFTPFEISPDHFGDFVEIEDSILWVGSTESVLQLKIDEEYIHAKPEVRIWSIQSTFDQEMLAYSSSELPEIAYDQKSIQINVVSSSFHQTEKNEFHFKYEDAEWSEWRQKSEITINPFLPGKKHLSIQTRDLMMVESEPKLLSITILAPWYLSNVAYLVYILIFGVLIGLVVRSISNYRIRQQMNAIKIREIERILELDELKTKLLINISHELRTPLTLVTGPVKQLLDSGKVEDGFLLRKLQIAHRNGRRLHDLVEQVLDLSRLDSNIMQFTPVEIPLNAFVQQVVQSFETAIEMKALKVEVEVPDSEILFQADADKLEKILVNLISNAIKFTSEKGEVKVEVINRGDQVEIKVQDSGRGISQEDLEVIFDRFHSTSDQLEGGGQGIGVGLSITKEFVEIHEGSIEVTSELGNGSTFVVHLPFKHYENLSEFSPGVEDSDHDTASIHHHLSVNGKEYSALVVEDIPDMREYVAELLEQLNIRVEKAQNGVEGKKSMSLQKPDIVISDIMMPEMNGFEFAEWMRSVPEYKQVPIILLSARSEVEDKVHGFQIGISDYLTKPFNAQELQARVDNLLVLKKEREEAVSQSNEAEEPSSADSELVQQLQEYVEGHLHQSKISVDELANHVAMSVRNLQRLLKEITGFTPNEFIREIRLFAARDLFETKQKRSISEVAYAVGFSTPAYFTKQYKKRFGASPSSYF
ncbi:MAG: response regulator [Balneolaceae bacterium]|nr:response regulator [Balneolaceae bacterium]